MANFTEEIKEEIIFNGLSGFECKRAFLSAFIRTSGSVISRGGKFGFEIVTENERTADFLSDMLENEFAVPLSGAEAQFDRFTRRDKLTFSCVGDDAEMLLRTLKILNKYDDEVSLSFGIDDALVPDIECVEAYLKGAFLRKQIQPHGVSF